VRISTLAFWFFCCCLFLAFAFAEAVVSVLAVALPLVPVALESVLSFVVIVKDKSIESIDIGLSWLMVVIDFD
jgi:hypothetical protein